MGNLLKTVISNNLRLRY